MRTENEMQSWFNRKVSYKFNRDTRSPYRYPARLHYLVVASQAGLNLEQLLEDVLKWVKTKKTKKRGGISIETSTNKVKELLIASLALTPCFMMSLA